MVKPGISILGFFVPKNKCNIAAKINFKKSLQFQIKSYLCVNKTKKINHNEKFYYNRRS